MGWWYFAVGILFMIISVWGLFKNVDASREIQRCIAICALALVGIGFILAASVLVRGS